MPNILVDKQVLPELLQDEVNGENIARLARDLYKDTESAKKVKEAAKELLNNFVYIGNAEPASSPVLWFDTINK